MLLLLLLIQVATYAQTDSTDLIVQKIMKEQRITGLSLAIVKDGIRLSIRAMASPM